MIARSGSWRFVVAFLLCSLLVRGLFHLAEVEQDARRRDETLQYLEFTARIAAQGLSRVFTDLDECFELLFSRATASESNEEQNREVMRRITDLLSVESRGVVHMSLIAADGRIILSEPGDTTALPASPDQIIENHRNSGAQLTVSEPAALRDSGRWSLRLSRRLALPDGTFLGVGTVTIAIDRLVRQMQSYVWRTGQSITLFRDDGLLLATSADINPRMLGLGIRTARRPLLNGVYAGEDSSPITGDARFMHLRTLPETQFYIAVSEPIQTSPDTTTAIVRPRVLAEGTIIIVFGILLFFLNHHSNKQKISQEKEKLAYHNDIMLSMFSGRDEVFILGAMYESGIYKEEFTSAKVSNFRMRNHKYKNNSEEFLGELDPPFSLRDIANIHDTLRQGGRYSVNRRFATGDGRDFLLRLSFSLLEPIAGGVRFFAIVEKTEGSAVADAARARSRMAAMSALAAELIRDFVQKMTVVSLAAENSSRKLATHGEEATGFVAKRLSDISRVATDLREETSRIRAILQEPAAAVEQITLQSVVSRSLFLGESTLSKAGAVVQDDVAVGLPPVLANRTILEFVLFTFLTHAARQQATTPGASREIRIAASSQDAVGTVALRIEYNAPTGTPAPKGDRTESADWDASSQLEMVQYLIRSMWAKMDMQSGDGRERITLFLRSDR